MKESTKYLGLFLLLFVFSICLLGQDTPKADLPENNAQPAVLERSDDGEQTGIDEDKSEKKEFKRPKFKTRRFEEDWSGLANRDRRNTGDFFDTVKFIPLSEDEKIWVGFGGQVRFRLEGWNNFAFRETGPRDDIFFLTRFFAHGELNIGEYFRVFIQGKSAFSTERDLPGSRRGLDVDELALHNAFAEVKAPLPFGDKSMVIVRGGRQELLLGKERLVSPLDWSNTRRIFDGFSGVLKFENASVKSSLTTFWVRPVPVQKYSFNDNDTDTSFYGLYGTLEAKESGVYFEPYWFYLSRANTVFSTVAGDLNVHTIGGRVGGKLENFDFDIEGAYQFGDINTSDIDAFMINGDLGYSFAKVSEGTPRLHFGIGYASGDDSPGQGKVNTFNQLFPLGHAYMGWMDFVGRQNVVDIHTGFSLKGLMKHFTFLLNGHVFWRAQDQDALYNAGGGIVRPGTPGSSSRTGSEIDMIFKYQHDKHLWILVGYSHFFADDYIEDTKTAQTGDQDMDFVYLSSQYTF